MSPVCRLLQLVDKCGKVCGWLDAGEAGTGNWMKYIRSTEQLLQRNMMAVQVDEQVRDVCLSSLPIRKSVEKLVWCEGAPAPPCSASRNSDLKLIIPVQHT